MSFLRLVVALAAVVLLAGGVYWVAGLTSADEKPEPCPTVQAGDLR